MKPALLFCFILMGFAHGAAMAATAAPVAGSSSRLYVDGADAGAILAWEGGDFRAKAVTAGPTGTKAPGSPGLAPVTLRVAFPPAAPLASWISEVAAGGSPRRTLLLVDSDALRRPAEAYEVSDALLTEIVFPALDASAAAFGAMQLVFTGARGSAVSVPARLAPGPARTLSTGFQLSVAGLEGKGVSRIEGLTIRQAAQPVTRGAERFAQAAAGTTEISNLRITLSRATASTWRAWHADYVINAAGPGATKREAVIALIDPTGTPGPISLVLTGCGILSLSRPPDTAGVAEKYVAELFIEKVAFTGLPPVVGGPKAATKPEPAPADKPAPAVGAANPADKGLRDPAEFPRVSDLVRLTYSGTYDKTYTSEQATYSAAESANSLLARVTDAAKKENWELRTFDENEGDGVRQLHQLWVRDKANVGLTISEKQDVKGSQLILQVYVALPAP